MTTADAIIMLTLTLIPLSLTIAMFATKQAMLGFPCAMFWAIGGACAYVESVAPWGDVYYYLAFGSLGMTIFTMLAAFALREKRDTLADDSMDEDSKEGDKFFDETTTKPSNRTKALRGRAERRREKL